MLVVWWSVKPLMLRDGQSDTDAQFQAWNKAFAPESLRNYRSMAQVRVVVQGNSQQARTDQFLEILQREASQSKQVDISHWIALWAM